MRLFGCPTTGYDIHVHLFVASTIETVQQIQLSQRIGINIFMGGVSCDGPPELMLRECDSYLDGTHPHWQISKSSSHRDLQRKKLFF